MQKKKIETLKDLQDEKKLVSERLQELEQDILNDVDSFKHDLETWSTAGGAVKHLFMKNKDSVMGNTAGAAVDMLIRKVLLRKSNFVTRFLISFIMKNVVRNIAAKKSDAIVDKVKKMIGNVADETQAMAE